MFRSLQCLFLSFGLIGLIASFQVLAIEPYEPTQYDPRYSSEPGSDTPVGDDPVKDYVNATVAEQKEQANSNARQAQNTQDIAEIQRMTGTQDFILKLVAIVMPLLIAMMTGVMLYIQIKQKTISEVRQVQQREDLILVARSVNGMKTELVATKELNAFVEALTLVEENKISENAKIRLAELQEAVRYATEKANALAHDAVSKLDKIQGAQPALASNTVNLAQGEQQIMEGVQFGDEPLNHDAIGVSTGQVKNVVGVGA